MADFPEVLFFPDISFSYTLFFSILFGKFSVYRKLIRFNVIVTHKIFRDGIMFDFNFYHENTKARNILSP